MDYTGEMHAALLNRYILAELLPSELDECGAVVTRRLVQWEAHGTRRLHVSTKGIERTSIQLLDQRAQLMPTISLLARLDEIKSGVQSLRNRSVSPFISFCGFTVSKRNTYGIEMRTKRPHSETNHCNLLFA